MTRSHGLALMTALLACTPTRAPKLEPGPAEPAAARPAREPAGKGDLTRLFARELAPLPRAIAVRGRGWKAEVNGKAPRVSSAGEGMEEITIPLGTRADVSCLVFPEPIDPATTLAKMLASLTRNVKRASVTPQGVFVEQESPVYFLDSKYTLDRRQGKLAGEVKLAMVARGSKPILCLHDEPGYVKTFEDVVRGLARTIHVQGEIRPLAVAISVVRLGETPVGFAQSWQEKLPDGNRVSASLSARIVASSPTELTATDDASRLVVAADRVKEGVWVEADTRGVHLNVVLKPAKGHEHEVSGTANDKPVSGTLSAPGGIPSGRATARRVAAELATGKPFRFTQEEYDPSVDPLGLVEMAYWHDATDGPRVVHQGTGQVQIKTLVDEEGFPTRAEVDAGSMRFVIEQIYERDDEKTKPRMP